MAIEFGGFLYNDAGTAVANATLNLYDRNTVTPVRATTTTDSNGWWTISHATQGRFDVEVVNGSSKRRRKYDTREQLEYLEVANFRIRNPGDTFEYDIVPAAITAARQLNLPLITGTDTLMTLGLAQTVTGVLTLTTPAIGDATGTSLVLTGNLSAEDLLIEDSDASHYLTITTTSNLTAARTLTIVPGDASRTITLSGDTTLSGTNTGDVTLAGTPDYITITNQVITRAKLDPADDLNTFASSVLATLVTDETGSGALVFGTAPTIAGGTHTALTGLGIRSTGTGAFDMTIANAENLAAGRTLTIQLGDAARTLILGASPSLSGTNTGDQTITLTGDVTGTGTGSFAATIASAAVSLAKMANLAQDAFIGRVTASTGVPETATITAAARTVLDDTTVGAMVDTLGGAATTGTGGLARATSPTFVTPALGTPASGVMTNVTGIPEGALSLTDITTANASATAHGFVPKWPNNTTTFFRGDGTYAAPGGGGAVTRAGGNTTEATTTSGTQVDLLSVTSLSIVASTPIAFWAAIRKANAAGAGYAGLKVNATTVRKGDTYNPTVLTTASQLESAIYIARLLSSTSYLRAAQVSISGSGANESALSTTVSITDADMPAATITSLILVASIGASNTMGSDDAHVYTYSVS